MALEGEEEEVDSGLMGEETRLCCFFAVLDFLKDWAEMEKDR